jgi:hypothetical protein
VSAALEGGIVLLDTRNTLTVDLRRYRFGYQAGRAVILLTCAGFIALLAWSMNASFVLSRYESRGPGAHSEMRALSHVPWLFQGRYAYDKNTLLLADFNSTREPVFLARFLAQNGRWMQERISPDAAYNQTLVLHFLHRDEEGRRLFLQSRALFPGDKRFGHKLTAAPSG